MAFQIEDTHDSVINIIASELSIPKENIQPATTFKDLGADSLDIASMIMSFEDTFGIEIKDEEAEKIAVISDAVDLIHKVRTK